MKKIYKNCNPTICNRSELMGEGGEFMTIEKIKEQCDCITKGVCIEIVRCLKKGDIDDAEYFLDFYFKQ